MSLLTEKINYIFQSIRHQFDQGVCPYCQSSEYETLKRKYVITRLVKCKQCELRYRIPNDRAGFNETFYQTDYQEPDGITTDLPAKEDLARMIRQDFKDTGKTIDNILPVLQSLFPDLSQIKMVDYGASWGYISYQLKKQGIDVESYEISKSRAAYGSQNLGLDIKTNFESLRTGNNIFFSSHVIEHVPSVSRMMEEAKALTGEHPSYFVAYCPNGSDRFMKKNPSAYHQHWGLVHPNFISDEFIETIAAEYPYYLDSNPYNQQAISEWDKKSHVRGDMSGYEMLIIIRLTP